jgi:two-component system response regulator NreC
MPIRIVIVDDHAIIRSGLVALLAKEPDFEIVGQAASGMDAIKLAEGTRFDVLLLDLSMPGISGTKTAEELLRRRPKLAIVVLTMHADEHYLRELFRIGVRAYVLKRSTDNDLINAIRAAYRGEHYVDPSMAGLLISPYVGRATGKKYGRLALLTAREVEVCQLLAHGYTNPEVSERLSISVRTVEAHRNNIMTKLGLESRADLVHFAIDNGLLKTE